MTGKHHARGIHRRGGARVQAREPTTPAPPRTLSESTQGALILLSTVVVMIGIVALVGML
jgi:hypothetical protein